MTQVYLRMSQSTSQKARKAGLAFGDKNTLILVENIEIQAYRN